MSLEITIMDVTIGANIIFVSCSVIRSDCISRQDNVDAQLLHLLSCTVLYYLQYDNVTLSNTVHQLLIVFNV